MAVNKHLEHVDELIFTRGAAGAKLAIQTLKAVGSTLSPSGGPPITITTKWDGAPAVICGREILQMANSSWELRVSLPKLPS